MANYILQDRDRRRVLARAALLSAVAPVLPELYDLRRSGPVAVALGSLHTAAEAAADGASSDAHAVEMARERWCSALAVAAGDGVPQPEEQLIRSARELAASRVRPAPDSDPFDGLFEAILALSATVYRERWPGATLEIAKLIEHPRPQPPNPDPYVLDGLHRMGAPPVVGLSVFPEEFGPATWAAVPSILIHECVCHVPALQRGQVKNTSQFAEGFIHWAAMRLFAAWIGDVDADLAPAAIEHADAFWQALSPPASSAGAARRRGCRAAERLVAWMHGSAGLPRAEAEVLAVELALELNAQDRSLALKDHLVERINAGPDPALQPALHALLKGELTAAELL